MHLTVHDLLYEMHNKTVEVCDEWIMRADVLRKQYLSRVVNRGLAINGLYVWLAAHSQNHHLNIIHTGGIWTTRASEMVVMMDAALVFIIRCFLSTTTMKPTLDHDVSTDSEFLHPFCHPGQTQDKYIHVLLVLNKSVLIPAE